MGTIMLWIIGVIAFVAWSWFLLLFGKHNKNKAQKIQDETNALAAAAEARAEKAEAALKAYLARQGK